MYISVAFKLLCLKRSHHFLTVFSSVMRGSPEDSMNTSVGTSSYKAPESPSTKDLSGNGSPAETPTLTHKKEENDDVTANDGSRLVSLDVTLPDGQRMDVTVDSG